MRIAAYILILLLASSNAFAQSNARHIQSSDVVGALGYTPLQSIGGMIGPAIICGSGILCSANTISASSGGTSGQIQYNNGGVLGGFTLSGDATVNTSSGVFTLSTVNSNVGTFGSATNCVTFTTNGKGLITAASQTACTPAVASISGLGTGVATALGVNVGLAGSFVTNGGALGTPSSGTLTNATGLPISTGVSGLGTGVATWLGTPSSANLRAALTDETGSGAAVFATAPNITNPTGIVKADVGLGNVANVDTTNASNISSGTLATARGGFPQGAWSSFSPSASCTSGTLTVNSAVSQTIAKTTFVAYDVSVTAGTCTSASTDVSLGLPATAATVGSTAAYEYIGGTYVYCSIKFNALTTLSCRSGANMGTGSRFSISLVYQNT